MFSNLVNKASKFAMEGVKNLVVKQHVSARRSFFRAMALSLSLR